MTYQELYEKAKLLEFRAINFCGIDYVIMSVEKEREIVSIAGDVVKLQLTETDNLKSSTIWLDKKDINRYIRLFALDVYDDI